MKKGRFLWSAYRITERWKAGKARNIKGKQLKNSRSTVSKPQDVHLSSQRDNQSCLYNPDTFVSGFFYTQNFDIGVTLS